MKDFKTKNGFFTGNVGIGTTNPGKTLHIAAGAHHIALEDTNGTAGSKMVGIYNNNQQLHLGRYSDDNFNDFTTDLFINSTGNVGIGTTNPAVQLNIKNQSTTSNKVQIGFTSQDGTQNAVITHTDEAGEERLALGCGGFNFEHFVLDNSGNVGIGTTNPSSLLEIKKDAASGLGPVLNLTNYGGGYYCQGAINFVEGNQSIRGQIRFETEPGGNLGSALYYGTRSADGGVDDIFVIKNSGNVGIGTTNPSSPLTVWGANDTTFDNIGNVTFIGTDAYNSNAGAGIIFGGRYNSGNNITTFGQISIIKENNTDGDYGAALTLGTRAAGASSSMPMEKMRITSAGNVGIGTTNPSAKLDIGTPGGSAGSMNQHIKLTRGTTVGAYFSTIRDSASNDVSGLVFGVDTTNALTIKDGGNVGIGTTNPTSALTVQTNNAASGYTLEIVAGGGGAEDKGIKIIAGQANSTSAGSCKYIEFYNGNGSTLTGGIRNASTSTVGFYGGSDVRIKKNINDTSIEGINSIKALKLRSWDWNSTEDLGGIDIGLIADELEEVFPELVVREKLSGWEHCVSEGEEDLKTIPSESKITLTLVKAIQEQQSIIEDLKSQNESLAARISALES